MKFQVVPLLAAALCFATTGSTKLAWKDTKFLFAFGDSYTTDGFNISAGVDSPVPNFTSANGPNWVQYLGGKYNLSDIQVFNLASGGATIDAALVPPFQPTVLSIVDQVSQFKTFLSRKPAGAEWDSSNSLFAFWIGINDVGNSAGWTNITRPDFYKTLMNRLTTQLDELQSLGARSFLFLTVPPTDRAPLSIVQGPQGTAFLRTIIAQYNEQLRTAVSSFQRKHTRTVEDATIFDSQPVFNTLLDNADALGYVNVTGFCTAYQNGIGGFGTNTQVEGCAPVASYFWLNTLHPLFTIHDTLARAISTTLTLEHPITEFAFLNLVPPTTLETPRFVAGLREGSVAQAAWSGYPFHVFSSTKQSDDGSENIAIYIIAGWASVAAHYEWIRSPKNQEIMGFFRDAGLMSLGGLAHLDIDFTKLSFEECAAIAWRKLGGSNLSRDDGDSHASSDRGEGEESGSVSEGKARVLWSHRGRALDEGATDEYEFVAYSEGELGELSEEFTVIRKWVL
ncbi:hypothetical protein NP233_g5806 [Leucocoprinus birnbaumii]|uniref:Carbohydrate esterase family 16 protein n=1 Tax=Leucocoprinus birnbaumii TaxID=56174 RepID=A0AAD5VUV4_9AGAR|nr:hypothetical protein NP233_g5806 [Leucocoprinus birnbaumii]